MTSQNARELIERDARYKAAFQDFADAAGYYALCSCVEINSFYYSVILNKKDFQTRFGMTNNMEIPLRKRLANATHTFESAGITYLAQPTFNFGSSAKLSLAGSLELLKTQRDTSQDIGLWRSDG